MTDIEERDKAESNSAANRSIKGSIFNSPKEFRMLKPSRGLNESQVSMLSQSNLALLDNRNLKHMQDFLRYDGDRALDISMSSVCSTSR